MAGKGRPKGSKNNPVSNRQKQAERVAAKAAAAEKDAEKIRKLKLLKLREAEEICKLQMRQYEDTHKTEFFKPLPHQEKFFRYILDGKKTALLVGASRIGKTVGCVNLIAAFMLGCKFPWNGESIFPSERAKESNGMGVTGRILCKDWEKSAKTVIVPSLKEWLPVGTYETKKNNVGVESEWYFPNTKSSFNLCTYNEDTQSQMGWKGDFVHADEPPPRDKYIANRRGLVDYNGIFTMAMTAIAEPWILDEIVLEPDISTGIVADIPITDNSYLTEEAIRIYEKDLNEDEKVAMIHGGWLQLTGRIWKIFNLEKHIVEPFIPHVDMPCDFQIDFHLDKPHAISFRTVNGVGQHFIWDEVWQNMGNDEIVDEIVKRKQKHGLRMKYGEIDPLSKGDSSYVNNRFGRVEDSFNELSRKLRPFGIALGAGSKDEKSYIRKVEEMLKGPNGIPLLYITRNCKETIRQVTRWAYDDSGHPKADGHFPECIGRFTQNGLKYTRPADRNRPFHYAQMAV
jgi:hypothetical protein